MDGMSIHMMVGVLIQELVQEEALKVQKLSIKIAMVNIHMMMDGVLAPELVLEKGASKIQRVAVKVDQVTSRMIMDGVLGL